MKKTYLVGLVVFAIIALGIVAIPKTMAEKQKEKVSVSVKGATPENPVVYLGKKYDKQSNKEVEGYAIAHYAKSGINKPTKPSSGSTCYGFLANGAKWKGTPEGWVVNTANTEGLDPDFIVDNLNYNVAKWEGYAGKTVLGSGVVTTETLIPDETAPDGINEVVFGDVDSQGAIAVTIIWGIFGGNPNNRQLVEWDMIFDEVDFNWGIGDPTKMDFENIATHELGHAMGMADLYTTGCNQETMYGYADNGQTNKRDLNAGDITGIGLLY